MFRVLFLAKIIVVCIPADFPIILCFHFSCFLYSVLKVHGVLSASLQSVPVPLLLRKNAFGEAVFTTSVVGSMWTVHLSLSAFVDSPHFASPFGEVVFTTSMVGSSGLEPPTSRLSGVRSNHLSYEPISLVPRRLVSRPVFACFLWLSPPAQPVVEMNRFELSTPCLQGRCSPN